MEYTEYKRIYDILVILQNLNQSDFVRDYSETELFTYENDVRVFGISCALGKYNFCMDELNTFLFKCQYYLKFPEEWSILQAKFANIVE